MVRELSRPPAPPLEPARDTSPSSTRPDSGRLPNPLIPPTRSGLIGRVSFLATAAYAFAAGLRVYDGAGIWEPAIFLGLVLYIGAVLSLLGAFWVRDTQSTGVQIFLASVVLIALVSSVAFEISVVNRSYGTDSLAVAHIGGEVLLEGENPYSVYGEPLAPLIDRFGVPQTFVTQTTSGDAIDRLVPYPGGHVLAYTSALALGVQDLRWATLIFEILALAVIWWALSPRARLLVPLVLLIEPNLTVQFTSGAVTDWLWVLPLVLTAIMLHREKWGYAGLALGIACAMKQQPWFAVPFVIVWAFMQMRRHGTTSVRRDLSAMVVGMAAGFAVLNLPFIVWSPGDWFAGTFSQVVDDLVPDGEGLSVLVSRGFLPLPEGAFSIAMVLAFLLTLFVYVRRFDRTSNLLWVLPPAFLLFSHRSMHNYFIFWIPIAALWLDLESGPDGHNGLDERRREHRRLPRHGKVVIAACIAVVMASAGIGLHLASGDYIEVGSVRAQTEDGMVTALDVELANTGADPVRPVFSVYWGRYPVPWEPASPTQIEPGESAVVRIIATTHGVIPPLVMDEAGEFQPKPFRVRVNDSGHSTYTSSGLVSLESVDSGVINPGFRYWGRSGGIEESPFGWMRAGLAPPGTSVQARALGGDRGVSLTVTPNAVLAEGWVEAALVQQVANVASCYRMDFSNSHDYSSNAEGRPVAATGLQVIQGDTAVWFVPSEINEVRLTDLPEGTRIVEVPATVGPQQELTFDLRVTAVGSGIELGQPGTIKLFSALNEARSDSQELRVSSVAECSGQS